MPAYTAKELEQARKILRDGNPDEAIVPTLKALGEWKAVEAVPDMMRYIDDPRPDVKDALQTALFKIGQEAIPAIVDYLPHVPPEKHVSLQSLVESFWKEGDADQIRRMMQHEDNRVRWAMAWTLAKPLRTIPPEEIGYIFEGMGDESVTAIRWAATQSLTTLVHTSETIPTELIRVALPVMVDNFKYGDVNLSEASVQAIALLTSPPNPAITAMLTNPDQLTQVAAVKVLTAWVQDQKQLDSETMEAFKKGKESNNWLMNNEIARLRYVLEITYPELLPMLEDTESAPLNEDDIEDLTAEKDIRITTEIMLLPATDKLPATPEETTETPEDEIQAVAPENTTEPVDSTEETPQPTETPADESASTDQPEIDMQTDVEDLTNDTPLK